MLVNIEISGNKLIITSAAPKYTLKGLLDGVSKKNIHREVETGRPKGAEKW